MVGILEKLSSIIGDKRLKNSYKFILCLSFIICISGSKTILPKEGKKEEQKPLASVESRDELFRKRWLSDDFVVADNTEFTSSAGTVEETYDIKIEPLSVPEKVAKEETVQKSKLALKNIFKKLGFESENYYFNNQKKYWVVGKDEDTYLVYKEKQECLKGIPFNVYRFIDEYEKKKIAIVSYLVTEKIDWIIKKYPGCDQAVAKATIYFYIPKDEILDFLQECSKQGHKLAVETYMSPNYDTICIK